MIYYYSKKDLMIKKVSWKMYILALFLSLGLFSSVGFTSAIKLNRIVEKIPIIIRPSVDETCNVKNITNEIKLLNLEHPDIVFQQIMLETNGLKSHVFRKNHNLFGMKIAFSRQKLQRGEMFNHCVYGNWKESLYDYSLYQARYASGLTKEQYYQFLKEAGYSESPNYIEILRKIPVPKELK